MSKLSSLLLCAISAVSTLSVADEGMWQPHQLPSISKELTAAGLELNPTDLTNLTEFPMGAIVSLGGCTASFVSDQALVVSNHHCVYGSVQYNSTEENNLLKNGFLAKSFAEELPAAPGQRIYVTEEITEVTPLIKGGITTAMKGDERYKFIDTNSKKLVSQCEQDKNYRCSVVNFHGGLEYYLFKQLMIRDVRLVHAPASSVGKYGGDIDNWMWPRHTGDYGFYRAYVGKDGQPADYSVDNVPYQPKHHLKVNKASVNEDDYIMVLGYPGRTNRYRVASEVEHQFTWAYPVAKSYREEIINLIHENSEVGSDKRIKYQNELASLANYAKNYGSLIESYNKGTTLERKQQLEAQLSTWINSNPKRKAKYGSALSGINKLVNDSQEFAPRSYVLSYMARSKLLTTANKLHRLAIEKAKPDLERQRGYQERDMDRFAQGMKTINRRLDLDIDQKILTHMLTHYAALPEKQRIKELDQFFALENGLNETALKSKLDAIYKTTELADEETRLAWMNKSVEEFNNSNDPFIQLAVNTFKSRKAIEDSSKELAGNLQAYRPKFMEALIAYNKSKDIPVYADANSTLRVTYGNVKGYSPKDGITAAPFTTVEGIVAKDTGAFPFDAPKKQLDLINKRQYGSYTKDDLNTVPVNFLGTLDITGGNSGSPTLNSKAEFVGLVFDGVYESIIGGWDYDAKLNRSIHVDVRYMLWVMEHIDGATNLIDEMDIVEMSANGEVTTTVAE
ncbi:S46 family peptidase [Thalassotalea psychrophila]|uniref:Dipeptidyl-peptidase n=1 Tax=Thalassotalea psychrophila TaxID=3065647 RepID=A0ABY9TPL5_9GAMM|nr:S46 family peptidase [Colwelliaceae bacterium SQ149]